MGKILELLMALFSFIRNGFLVEQTEKSFEEMELALVKEQTLKHLPTINHKLITISLFILCTLYTLLATAQNFPVQVVPQAIPPAPIYVSNYADASTISSPLRVQITLNDFEIANREIRIKTYFEGSALSFQSNDIVVGASPLFLEGGLPLILTNTDLAPYFRFENITGINGNQYGNPIPEGAYQFCIEVYDVLTGNRLSNKSCALSVVFQNEPPFLVLPRNKTNVEETNPQNIVFQWTPRSINVTNVQYELSLVEIWDTQVDPQQAFLSSPPIFQTTTTATTYVYSPSDPLLLSGKNYAWRVQAKAQSGIEEIGLFKNQGYSEIFSFSHAESCDLPTAIAHEVKGSTNANIFWDDFSTEIPEYTVRYRQKNVADAEWFTNNTTANETTLWDLKAGTTYQYQILKQCAVTGSEWSIIKEFTTFIADNEESVYDCNITPEFDLSNLEPLQNISTGEQFTAGDFPINVLTASGSNGYFTGTGYVTIPYLNSIRVSVKFTNILINTDKKLAEGTVVTMYDPTLSNILDIDEAIDTVENIVDSVGEFFEGDTDRDEITVNWAITKDDIKVEDGFVIITNPNTGATKTEPLGDDMAITDSAGNTFYVTEDGEITEGGQVDDHGSVNGSSVTGVSNNGQIEALTAPGIKVTFNTEGSYGIDMMPTGTGLTNIQNEYTVIKDATGADYALTHHAVKLQDNTTIVGAISIQNSEYDAEDLIFKNKIGEIIPRTIDGSTVSISLPGRHTFENETIYALVESKVDSTKQLTAGAFTLWHLSERNIDVAIVSVGASMGDVETTVQNIFKTGVANINFKPRISLNANDVAIALGTNGMDIGDSPFTAAYNAEQKALKNLAKAAGANDPDTYYIIVLGDEFLNTKQIAGFMPLQRQYGFVFERYTGTGEEAKGTIAKTLAHEIGHGIFALQHPFTEYGSSENATDWLMDYSDGDNLPHTHWAQIHNPDLKFYIFQDEEDGEIANKVWFTPDWKPFTVGNNSNTILTIKSQHVNGTVWGFKLNNGITYKAISRNGVTTYETDSVGQLNPYPIIEKQLNEDDIIYLFDSSGNCNKRWKATYKTGLTGFNNYTDYLSNPFEYPCSNCEEGQEFIESYKNITDELTKDIIVEIGALICSADADPSFLDELRDKGIANMYGWQQTDYLDGNGDISLDAFLKFKYAYEIYILYFNQAQHLIQTSEDRKALLKIASNLTLNQLTLIDTEDKLRMLKIISDGYMGGYWTSMSFNTEAVAIKIINSITDNQSEEFIDGLTHPDYYVDDKPLYEVLYSSIDDFFGESNYTTIAHKFNNLALKARGLDYDSITNEQINSIGENRHFLWDVENADYWLVKFVNDKNPIIVTKIGETFTLKQNCIAYLKANYNPYGSTPPVCINYETDISGLNPFDLVSINIIEDINITQSDTYPFDYAINGKTTLVPVTFIMYLQEKKSNQQLTNFAFNTLTVASIYLSGAEIIAAKGITTLAARLAVADLFITFSDPYFSNPEYFHTHATNVLKSDLIGLSSEDAESVATALQMAWTVVSTAATINTGVDAVNPQVQMEAFANYKALVNKVGKSKAKEIISADATKGTKITDNFDSFEEKLVDNPSIKSEIDERVAEIENNIFNKLNGQTLNDLIEDDVLQLTSGWDDDALALLFEDLLDTQNGGNLIEALNNKPELVISWGALNSIGVDDIIRKNPEYLKNIDNYVSSSGKSYEEVSNLALNNENGIEQFLDELEATPASGYWDNNPFQRGRDIEDALGQNLPETFKTIDKYDNGTGKVTSIKSLDLDAKTYETTSKLKSRLNKYIEELENFDGYQLEGVEIGGIENPINSKVLELAIPRAATGNQLITINEVIESASTKNIEFIVIIFP
ncbi:fibronectin type III domain-containing protein [Maribacter aquivivus]|uniref:endonuclease toxin domain-containing protein n=1 Tax=Maribacter aquivivus TaxID=228958 RepID=UPI002490DD3E|nr:fibronectin type III domain-containing protein [Maribacter aquivivus]